MSKSKGNVIVPTDILDKYGADAVRWRAAAARPGLDSPFDESQMKVGRRLAMKVLNASRFVLGGVEATSTRRRGGHRAGGPRAARRRCRRRVERATVAFEAYDYTSALEVTERFFWTFCDDYVELVKERAYGEPRRPAPTRPAPRWRSRSTCSCGCSRRSCPTSPRRSGRGGRRARCTASPGRSRDGAAGGDPALLEAASQALAALRGVKSQAKVSMRTEITDVRISAARQLLDLLAQVADDLAAAAKVVGEMAYLETAEGSGAVGPPVHVSAEIVSS